MNKETGREKMAGKRRYMRREAKNQHRRSKTLKSTVEKRKGE